MAFQIPQSTDKLFACSACDLLVANTTKRVNHRLRCPRCHTTLHSYKANSLNNTLFLSVLGLLLYLPSISLPLVNIQFLWVKDTQTILSIITTLFRHDYYLVASMLFLFAVAFPFILLALSCLITILLKLKRKTKNLPKLFRYYLQLQKWGMVEIYLIGVVITFVKMSSDLTIHIDYGFYCFLFLCLINMSMSLVMDKNYFWFLLEPADSKRHNFHIPEKLSLLSTAKSLGLTVCLDCHKIHPKNYIICSRCKAKLYSRKAASILLTSLFLLIALACFIPANTLPFMQVTFFGIPERSTIIDGILLFFNERSYVIGTIILCASILIPALKILGLWGILFTIRSGKNTNLLLKTRVYKLIEYVGRWSMLDIFVLGLLTVLVDFGFLGSIQVAPAAT